MFEIIVQRFTIAILVVVILQSEYSNRSVNNSQLFAAEAFSCMGKKSRVLSKNHKNVAYASRTLDPSQEVREKIVLGQPRYEIGGIDLSALWITLVRRNKVSASMTLPSTISSARDNSDKIDDDENDEKGQEKTNHVSEEALWCQT